MTEKHLACTLMKQDVIPRSDRPGTTKGDYLYVEDDQGCMIEQGDGTLVPDTEAGQVLPTDKITEAEAATYQVSEDGDDDNNDMETISSTSTADYDQEEVETSLTTISEEIPCNSIRIRKAHNNGAAYDTGAGCPSGSQITHNAYPETRG